MGKEISVGEIKKIELDILNQFVTICEKYNLRYYLMWGTLLGAVRHKGFIPWDDDIDVGMPRTDYEAFKEILGNNILNHQWKLLTWENRETNYNFMKMVDIRTIVQEKCIEGETGVWIDIFPIDGLPENYLLSRVLCMKLEFLRKLLFVSISRPNYQEKKLKNKIKNIIRPLARRIPSELLCEKINNVFLKYDYDSCKFVGAVSGGSSYRARIERQIYEEDYALFEGREYRVPKGRDKLLRQSYGDYMRLPPKNKRISHTFKAQWKIDTE